MRWHSVVILAGLIAALVVTIACSRVASQHPAPTPPPLLEYVGEWGVKGEGPGKLAHPVGLAVDTGGNVYIADGESGFVHKFDSQGHPLLSFQNERLRYAGGVALDRGGAIYVTDPTHGNVLVFLPDGSHLRDIGSGRRHSSKSAMEAAVDVDGNIFVVDQNTARIMEFNPRGGLIRAWGRKGSAPSDLEKPSNISIGPDGFLYISDDRDEGTQRILKFSRHGEFVSAWRGPESESGRPIAFAAVCFSQKYAFIADGKNHRLYVWTLDGQPKMTFDLTRELGVGRELPAQDTPTSLVIGAGGELLLLDPPASRVLRFRINF